ncbi:MAG TPA: winged helix DNA-binding domain-containing protein [Vicinamibacterales bacterium]|nr:winged helix DNA-binding domain-containing protein [Vicinamibacterales bacterium]
MSRPELLSTRRLNRALLARQFLLERQKTSVLRVLSQLVGLQAQVARPPFVGLWTRVRDFERDDLLRALRSRKAVRLTAMRGTLHLMTAKDAVALRGALQPMLSRGMRSIPGSRASDLDLDLDALDAAARTFFGRAPATFDALRTHLKQMHPRGDERAMAYAIRMQLPLVQMPTDAPWGFPASADFTLAETWLRQAIRTDTAPAHELVKRYLAAFGPATPADAQTWSGLQGLREVFEELRPKLVTFRDDRNRELFDLPAAPRPPEDTPAPVRFLPEFDNVLLSYADRSRVLDEKYRSKITTKNLLVPGTFLVDGFVAGTWKVERKPRVATLTLALFQPLTRRSVTPLEQEGQALLDFLEPDAATRNVRTGRTS